MEVNDFTSITSFKGANGTELGYNRVLSGSTFNTIQSAVTEFDLKDKTGHFFLRTKLNSYLYLLNPENKSKTFYIQQKKSFPIDFQFYHIKTNT